MIEKPSQYDSAIWQVTIVSIGFDPAFQVSTKTAPLLHDSDKVNDGRSLARIPIRQFHFRKGKKSDEQF
ncbi:MAG: hypothetical protein ACJAXW_001013 [Candidatus Azotimanducaceae bacterium]|jgi:hypothetical protein